MNEDEKEGFDKMRSIKKIGMIAVGLTLLAAGFAAGKMGPPTPGWQYNFVTIQHPTGMQALYNMGEDGWETVGIFKDWHTNQAVLLKRRM